MSITSSNGLGDGSSSIGCYHPHTNRPERQNAVPEFLPLTTRFTFHLGRRGFPGVGQISFKNGAENRAEQSNKFQQFSKLATYRGRN